MAEETKTETAPVDVELIQNGSGSKDSKSVVMDLVNLSRAIKEKSAEIKKMRDDYKNLGVQVRAIMQRQDITTIQAGGSNVTLYEKKLAQTLSKDFVTDSLTDFFKDHKQVNLGTQSKKVASEAANFLFDAKKNSDLGSQWSLTVRQPKKKEGSGTKRTRKRKADTADEEHKEMVDAEVVPKKNKVQREEF